MPAKQSKMESALSYADGAYKIPSFAVVRQRMVQTYLSEMVSLPCLVVDPFLFGRWLGLYFQQTVSEYRAKEFYSFIRSWRHSLVWPSTVPPSGPSLMLGRRRAVSFHLSGILKSSNLNIRPCPTPHHLHTVLHAHAHSLCEASFGVGIFAAASEVLFPLGSGTESGSAPSPARPPLRPSARGHGDSLHSRRPSARSLRPFGGRASVCVFPKICLAFAVGRSLLELKVSARFNL